MNKALNLAEEQSEDGWRPVMGRFWVAEAGVGCRGALEQNTEQAECHYRCVGHIRLLGEYHEPEPEDREMPLGCLWTGRKPVSVAEGPSSKTPSKPNAILDRCRAYSLAR